MLAVQQPVPVHNLAVPSAEPQLDMELLLSIVQEGRSRVVTCRCHTASPQSASCSPTPARTSLPRPTSQGMPMYVVTMHRCSQHTSNHCQEDEDEEDGDDDYEGDDGDDGDDGQNDEVGSSRNLKSNVQCSARAVTMTQQRAWRAATPAKTRCVLLHDSIPLCFPSSVTSTIHRTTMRYGVGRGCGAEKHMSGQDDDDGPGGDDDDDDDDDESDEDLGTEYLLAQQVPC